MAQASTEPKPTVEPKPNSKREDPQRPVSKEAGIQSSKQATMQAALAYKQGKLDLRKLPEPLQGKVQRASKYFSEQALAAMAQEPVQRPSPMSERRAPERGNRAKFT